MESSVQTDPLMSMETLEVIELALLVGVIPWMVLVGVIFNVINMAVFLRQGLADHINLCLFVLAIHDTSYLLFLASWKLFEIAHLIDHQLGEYWKARMMFAIGIYSMNSDMSNCMTMAISLERCICIVWPLRAKTILTTGKIKMYILVATLVCGLSLIFCFKYDIDSYVDPVTNVTRYVPTVTSFYLRNMALVDNLYEDVNIGVPTISFTVVIIATVVIAVRMRSVMAFRQDSANAGGTAMTSSKDRREAAVTRMLVVVCVIFTICYVPFVIRAFASRTVPQYRPEGIYSNTLFATTTIMHVFLCVNSSVNFLVYYNMSSKFKATLREMLRLKPADDSSKQQDMSRMSKTTISSELSKDSS